MPAIGVWGVGNTQEMEGKCVYNPRLGMRERSLLGEF